MELPDSPNVEPWRQRVMPILMAALRLAVLVLLFRGPLEFVRLPPDSLVLPQPWRVLFVVLLAVGAPLFCAPRTVFWGGFLLAAAVGAYQILWRATGLPLNGAPWAAVALLAVLVLGEWGGRAAKQRLRGRSD